MKVSKNQYKSIDLEVSTTVTKKKPTKKELLKSSQNMSNVLMQLRKVANHQLLMRRLYSDELIPSIAKDILKEVEFMESNLDFVIEDMHMMSDFELHTLCMKYSVSFILRLTLANLKVSACRKRLDGHCKGSFPRKGFTSNAGKGSGVVNIRGIVYYFSASSLLCSTSWRW